MKLFRYISFLFLAATLASGCSRENTGDTIRIGAILPLTGDAAQYGNNDKEGIMLAVNQANAKGGIDGKQITVTFEDCQGDAKKAVTAFNRLQSQNVKLIIDDAISTISLSLVPLLEKNEAILISTGASNPSLSGSSRNFFRVWNSDTFEGKIAAHYVLKSNPKSKIAILYINNDYGKGLHDVMTKELQGTGVKIAASETFEVDTRNFRPQIEKIKRDSPALVYLIGYAAQTGPAIRQIRESRLGAKVLGTVAMEDPVFVKLSGEAAEGVVYPFPTKPEGVVVNRFKQDFRTLYNKDPGLLHDVSFDAANIIIKTLNSGARTATEIREKLRSTKNHDGASGAISFDANGDVSKPMSMRVIKNSQFIDLR
jgi:branched-chain amino acid transport system substrate-binding protein